MTHEAQDLVAIHDATRITGLEKATLYRLARQGRVRSFRVLGTALRFERSDLMALVHERPARRARVKDARQRAVGQKEAFR